MEIADDETVQLELGSLEWERSGNELVKVVRRHDFREALAYVNDVGGLAEAAGHHPDIDIRWNTVSLHLSTHSLGGITDADLRLARRDRRPRLTLTSSDLPTPLVFVGTQALGHRPHIVVDGAPRPGSVAVLSHWPITTTPPALARDLSVEIAFAYVRDQRSWEQRAVAVTNDHFDADGLASTYVLTDPSGALEREAALVGLARAGDFDVETDRSVLRSFFALSSLAESDSRLRGTDMRYEQLLPILPRLLDDPDAFRASWEGEDGCYAASLSAYESGAIRIVDDPELSLAVVYIDESTEGSTAGIPPWRSAMGLHRCVIHSATPAVRILLVSGQFFRYYDRYETWVRYVSRQLPLRRSLGPIARLLTAEETSGGFWTAGEANAIAPMLEPSDGRPSSLDPGRVCEILRDALIDDPPAFDPFRPGGVPTSSARGASRSGTSDPVPARWRDRLRARPSA